MNRIFFILICFTFIQEVIAQRSPTITYRSSAQFNAGDLMGLFKKAQDQKSKLADTTRKKDSSAAEEDFTETDVKSFVDSFTSAPIIETRHIYREGDFVIIRDDEDRRLKKYNTKTLLLTVIDSSTYAILARVDTSIHPMLDEAFIYTIKKTNETRTLSGYYCEKFIIQEESNNDEKESREIIIWATKQIKPAIPVFTVLGFHKFILEEYTPLKMSEKLLMIPNTSNETAAVKIESR